MRREKRGGRNKTETTAIRVGLPTESIGFIISSINQSIATTYTECSSKQTTHAAKSF